MIASAADEEEVVVAEEMLEDSRVVPIMALTGLAPQWCRSVGGGGAAWRSGGMPAAAYGFRRSAPGRPPPPPPLAAPVLNASTHPPAFGNLCVCVCV